MSRLAIVLAAVALIPQTAPAAPTSARKIYEQASGAVVFVLAEHGPKQGSTGTGSIISRDGFVLTNWHVVSAQNRPAQRIRVFFKPKRLTGRLDRDLVTFAEAALVGANEKHDLALLRLAPGAPIPGVLAIAPEGAQPGDGAIAIGHPEDGGLWSVTTGIVSARIEEIEAVPGANVYQMQTPINPGNSGGPLLNHEGRIIGVNTSAVRVGKSGVAISGIQFAMAADVVLAFLRTVADELVPPPAAPPRPTRMPTSARFTVRNYHVTMSGAATHPTMVFRPADPTSWAHQVRLEGKHFNFVVRTPTATMGVRGAGALRGPASMAAIRDHSSCPGGVRGRGCTATMKAVIRCPGTGGGVRGVTGDPCQITMSGATAIKDDVRLPRRPYRAAEVKSAVDQVRARARDAFDELDRETAR
jgi:serine protease Do